ncbi:MAG: hypothetical protein ACXWEA_03330 [Solirubrobacterales bacterium]
MSGSRERKREDRRQRKLRAAQRQAEMTARSEARNEATRERLAPLPDGDRPRAVTAGAAVSAVVALIWTVSAVVAATGSVEVSGEEPSPLPLAGLAVVFWVMTWGMWKARYWAVLGFQMLLVLSLLSAALGLVQVTNVLQLVATLALLGGLGTLFYFLIKAMARIQMPSRPG